MTVHNRDTYQTIRSP